MVDKLILRVRTLWIIIFSGTETKTHFDCFCASAKLYKQTTLSSRGRPSTHRPEKNPA